VKFAKFNAERPSDQSAVDIFKGRWASALPADGGPLSAGDAPLFTADSRPGFAARAFGAAPEAIAGARVLELGPLEGGHTYQLEKLGADVLAIEGNAEAYLKCLIVKEIFGLKARFMLGDFQSYLRDGAPRFDLIFASGVLYHMADPLALIGQICRAAPRSVVWTHYYDPQLCRGFRREMGGESGPDVPHYRRAYRFRGWGRFWGGLASYSCWLERESILDAFRRGGHGFVEVVDENRAHPHGPCFTFITSTEPLSPP
jgi:hypothetical protein